MINRIPPSYFNFPSISDPDIINAYNWIRSYIHEKDWKKRISYIEKELSLKFKKDESIDISKGTLNAINSDKIGWYLYLVYVGINEPYKYDYFPSARILPIFKRLGMNLDMVKSISGINKKIRTLVSKRMSEADAILFEILTALLWRRNGWDVKILDEAKNRKTPDLEVTKEGKTWQVECKRQSKTANYTYQETEKRQKIISQVCDLLMQYDVLLDITFHVELLSLPETYLKDLLTDIIPKTKASGKLIQNDEIDIDISFIDYNKINSFLKEYGIVKQNSPQLLELIANRPVDHSSFTGGNLGRYYLIGEGEVNNLYFTQIDKAFGVECRCDAESAIIAKARDVKNQIHDAIKQFNQESDGIIHIGMETFDGSIVENERTNKITKTLKEIDAPNLGWIYLHYFQSYSRSEDPWILDETTQRITAYINPVPPLSIEHLIIPENEVLSEDISHWDRPLP